MTRVIRYYYFRDDKRAPRVTLCAVRDKDGRIGYGWSICSADDTPRREDWYAWDDAHVDYVRHVGGRTLARGRAEAALKKRGAPARTCRDTIVTERSEQTFLPHVLIYRRPVLRTEARAMLQECCGWYGEPGFSAGLWKLIDYHDPSWLPPSMRPESLSVPDTEESVDAAS